MTNRIPDAAGNKGTGNGLANQFLDPWKPLSLLPSHRYISTYKRRTYTLPVGASFQVSKNQLFKFEGDKAELIEKIRQALYFSKLFLRNKVLRTVWFKENNWNLPFADVASIGDGCIIRSRFQVKICCDAWAESRCKTLLTFLSWYHFLDVTAAQNGKCDIVVSWRLLACKLCATLSQLLITLIAKCSADLSC